MHILSIVNQKGGVGKTTTAVNLAASLAILGKSVLIIDLDPQSNATSGLGLNAVVKNIYDVLIDGTNLDNAIVASECKNLYIVPSTIDLSAVEIEILNNPNKERVLSLAIEGMTSSFDYCLIDCPPSLSQLTINALSCSHDVLIPVQCEFYALEGIAHLLNTISMIRASVNSGLNIFGILLTMYDKRYKLTSEVEREIRGHFGSVVFDTVIPRNVRIAEAPSHGLPVVVYEPSSVGAKAYQLLAKEVLQRFKE